MAFNSPFFLFVFGPLAIGLHALAPARFRVGIVLGASLLFYLWGEPVFALLVVALSFVDYVLCAAMARSDRPGTRAALLAAGVAANLATLVWYKYVYLLADALCGLGLPACVATPAGYAIPLGVSFVVFEKITYLVDTYRRVSEPARSFGRYLVFVLLFPKLIAGPILKFHEMRAQIERHTLSLADIEPGLFRFLQGLFKKVVLADGVAHLADRAFGAAPAELGAGDALLGALAFTVQIYLDFSAYSDMAIGLARCLGFHLPENFNQPYLSRGFRDFWTRWHISLSTWIRDYLYIPLGGHRGGALRSNAVLLICFGLSGLWHGAAGSFLLWGLYHGLLLAAERGWKAVRSRPLPAGLSVALTFGLAVVGWVLFRAGSVGHALAYLQATAGSPADLRLAYGDRADQLGLLALGLVISFLPLGLAQAEAGRILGAVRIPAARLGLVVLTLVSFGQVYAVTYSPFIYFRF